MNWDEIMAMEAGREIDTLVAEMVWGETKWCPEDPDDPMCRCSLTKPGTIHMREPLPEFSTDIRCTWWIVEKLIEGKRDFELHGYGVPGIPSDGFECHFTGLGLVRAETASLAICRAALLVMME